MDGPAGGRGRPRTLGHGSSTLARSGRRSHPQARPKLGAHCPPHRNVGNGGGDHAGARSVRCVRSDQVRLFSLPHGHASAMSLATRTPIMQRMRSEARLRTLEAILLFGERRKTGCCAASPGLKGREDPRRVRGWGLRRRSRTLGAFGGGAHSPRRIATCGPPLPWGRGALEIPRRELREMGALDGASSPPGLICSPSGSVRHG
jgi:hypothetical protein